MMTNEERLELAAEVIHIAWMTWAVGVLSNENISPDRKKRWESYMIPYSQLDEPTKEKDREWARRVLFNPDHNPN